MEPLANGEPLIMLGPDFALRVRSLGLRDGYARFASYSDPNLAGLDFTLRDAGDHWIVAVHGRNVGNFGSAYVYRDTDVAWHRWGLAGQLVRSADGFAALVWQAMSSPADRRSIRVHLCSALKALDQMEESFAVPMGSGTLELVVDGKES